MSASSGLKLEVYDTTGKRLYTQYPTMEPIEIGAFPNSGIYLIRAITAEGDIKHGRIVVK